MTQTWTSRLLEVFLRYIHSFSGIDWLAVIILRIRNTARLIKSSNKYLTHCGSNTPRAPAHQLNLAIRSYPLAVALGLHDVILHISVVVEDLIIYRSRTQTGKDAPGWVARQDWNVSRTAGFEIGRLPKPQWRIGTFSPVFRFWLLTVLNLVYLAKIIVYSMAPNGILVSASKCLVTRYWRERLIEINPRDLWKSLGHKSSLVALDLPLRVEFLFENPFTAYHLPSIGLGTVLKRFCLTNSSSSSAHALFQCLASPLDIASS